VCVSHNKIKFKLCAVEICANVAICAVVVVVVSVVVVIASGSFDGPVWCLLCVVVSSLLKV